MHAFFYNDVTVFIFADLTELFSRCLHIFIALAHVVHLLTPFLSCPPTLILLLDLTRVQMLVTLEESVLNPEHDRVESERNEHHYDDQLRLRAAIENDQ